MGSIAKPIIDELAQLEAEGQEECNRLSADVEHHAARPDDVLGRSPG